MGIGIAALLPALLAVSFAANASAQVDAPLPAGVIVEDAPATGTAARAGLRPGDQLFSWAAAGSSGQLATSFDVPELQVSRGQAGAVTLTGARGGQRLTATLDPGDWNLDVRPRLPPADEAAYEEARAALARGDVDAATPRLQRLAAAAGGGGDPLIAAFLHLRRGKALAAARRTEEARRAFQDALDGVSSTAHRAVILELESEALMDAPNDAIPPLREAVDVRRRQDPASLALAWDLANLAELTRRAGDIPGAEVQARAALALAEAASPGSLVTARSLDTLGFCASYRSGEEARPLVERAMAIRSRLAPVSAGMARSLKLLGGVEINKGDLRATEKYWDQALDMQRRVEPGGAAEALMLGNSSVVARERGDLRRAEALSREALEIYERTSSGSPEHVIGLTQLCCYAMDRGDWPAAEGLCRRAVKRAEVVGKDALPLAWALSNLAEIEGRLGRRADSDASFARAIALMERATPDALELVEAEVVWARLSLEAGDLARAKAVASAARARSERHGHAGTRYAETLQLLGDVAFSAHDTASARDLYNRALRIREQSAPASRVEAETLHALARLLRQTGDRDGALANSVRAVEALDRQRGRLGGTFEARSRFAALALATYNDHIELLLERDETAAAFHTLERSRARAFLDVLAERDVDVPEIPPERRAERWRLDAAYDQAQSALSRADEASAGPLVQKLREIADRRDAFAQRVAGESPSAAALLYPSPLDLAATRAALDPGTVLLAYAVADTRTTAFVVQPPSAQGAGVTAVPIATGDARLRSAVRDFLREIGRGPRGDAALLRRQGAELYALLVRPVEARLAGAKRIVISPDGPLHRLPFGALVRDGRPLVSWKPLSIVPSATVAAQLGRRRGATAWTRDLVAFADPANVHRPGQRALPATRREVSAIARRFPRRRDVWLGEEATEQRAKALDRGVRYVHFACHGVLDARFPLDSALVLAGGGGDAAVGPRGGENGLLQAWEILESVRVDADLVTLSACGSGLGEEVGGEGLLGLTRAFLYAGARSVVASLWAISDRSTSRLMEAFYGGLARGVPKDEALRQAQLSLIHAGGLHAHPFYWAAFQLTGDWR